MDPIVVSGVVVTGLKQGRTLGYPTINVSYAGALSAPAGVYAAYVRVEGGKQLQGAAIVGGDFSGGESPKLEVHVLGDDVPERYGEQVTVTLLDFASELVRVSDVDELKRKIENDIALIRKMF